MMRALAAFCSLLVCLTGSAGPAPLPEGIELEPRGEVTIIVSVGGFGRDIPWREITALLPVFAGVGADTLALWPVWDHIGPTGAIPVRTPTGPRDLRVGPEIHHWVPTDYTALDPHRGTEEEFHRLVEEAHRLGLKVVPVLQVTYALPGGFVHEHHPEWILRSETGGYAVTWPWYRAPWGYALDKSHPGLIEFVTRTVLPHWIEEWGVDGVWLDSPGMQCCSPRVRGILARLEAAPGAECLTPIGEEISTEPLARAMCSAIEKLEGELGRELVCAAETPFGGWADFPDAYIEALVRRDVAAARSALEGPEVGASCAPYWDWFCDYLFRERLMDVYLGGELSYSRAYVEQFELEARSPIPQEKRVRFVNQLNGWARHLLLLEPEVAGCYITLAATAPGRTFWIEGADLVLPEHRELLRAWYKRLVAIKRAFPALQRTNIEDALLEPQVKGLIAYNRWAGEEAVTVIVNLNPEPVECMVRTRFARGTTIRDLLSGEAFPGDPGSLRVSMPPHSARILAGYREP